MSVPSGAVLEVDAVSRSFGPVVALDRMTFTVPRGTVVGFLGPNGAGKTTAMRVVMGITAADHGFVRWRGRPMGRAERLKFGYMPEERGLYASMTVSSQVEYLARLHGMDAGPAKAATTEWLDRLGVRERAGDKVEALSLGNQQRVQLAAALVHDPELLVLDEPFSGLDPVGIEALSSVLSDRARAGAAVLFSSHQLDLVETVCELVVIVHAGRVVAEGSVSELTEPDGRHVVVEVRDARPGWVAEIPGAEIVDTQGDRLRIRLEDPADGTRVLDAARRAGDIRVFAFESRKLSEVFLEAVTGVVV